MVNITSNDNSVKVTDGNKNYLFPKGTVSAIAHKGDKQSVDLRLMGSRKNILTFRYDNCNMAESDAEETAAAIGEIL